MTNTSTTTRSVEKTLEIAASPEAVWNALTNADELTNWFPMKARVEPGEGGSIWMSWGEWAEGAGKIELWDPPHRLRIADGSSFGSLPTFQDWTIEGAGGVTTLRLVHSGFGVGADFDDEYDSVRCGWNFELNGMKLYLEHHAGQKREVVLARRPIDIDPAEAERRILGGTPPAVGETLSLDIPRFGPIEGTVEVDGSPRDYAAVIPALNDAYFRIVAECCGGPMAVNLWMSC